MIIVVSVIRLLHSGQVLKSWRRWDSFTSHFFSDHPFAVSLTEVDEVPVLKGEPELEGLKLVSAGSILKSLKLILMSLTSWSNSSSASL